MNKTENNEHNKKKTNKKKKKKWSDWPPALPFPMLRQSLHFRHVCINNFLNIGLGGCGDACRPFGNLLWPKSRQTNILKRYFHFLRRGSICPLWPKSRHTNILKRYFHFPRRGSICPAQTRSVCPSNKIVRSGRPQEFPPPPRQRGPRNPLFTEPPGKDVFHVFRDVFCYVFPYFRQWFHVFPLHLKNEN